MSLYGPTVLRLGLAILFLWFGFSQITNTVDWIAWVPPWAAALFGLSEHTIVLVNGWFETVGGSLLLLGLWTRIAASVLSLHLFSIAWAVGYNDIGVRDFALAVSTLALALFGPDRCTVDSLRKRNEGL
ncbi:MAG: hypothetical protein UY63_C0003G0017 [Parcubacteria group bacterium GW2011_GWA2_51_10]|nr:MAG: hypothetical protein UY63_C0003G0017 [Parcubacteria group bacterium GW2011_GWA2_51_10]